MTTTPERSDPPGPVTPPSLGEIFEISARRRRTRYRMVQGTLAVLSVAGVGLALQGRLGTEKPTDAAESPGELPSSTTATQPVTTAVVADDLTADTTVRPVDLNGCLFVPTEAPSAPWITTGRAAYFANQIVPVSELETIAGDWNVDFDEVKALVGFAAANDLRLTTSSIDEALEQWSLSGYTGEQLSGIAAEWNVSTTSVKMVHLIDDPELQASLEACGLEAPAE